jgi:co-chaperonin GroES (HSP10)
MKCTATKVLISVMEDKNTKNDLGLTLPSTLQSEGIEKAKVIYVGDEVKDPGLEEGKEIYIYSGAGKEFTSSEDNQKYRVITTSEIIVIF